MRLFLKQIGALYRSHFWWGAFDACEGCLETSMKCVRFSDAGTNDLVPMRKEDRKEKSYMRLDFNITPSLNGMAARETEG